jgi:ParB family transcriptional regulator, chromosome partitioning protein
MLQLALGSERGRNKGWEQMDNSTKRMVTAVNPFRCRVWSLHERLDSDINEATCRAEIESFNKYGQLVPVLGRPVISDPEYDIELIYGARRLFAARYLNKPLLVERRELSDHDAIIAMDIENRQRKDVSPYERGLIYARWLRAGLFPSQDDIARTLAVSASQVSRLLKLARLPSVVINAFPSAQDICEKWGLDLAEGLEDPERRRPIIQRARMIACQEGRPPACEVYRQLVAATGHSRRLKSSSLDKVVKGDGGSPLFRIRHQRKSIALILPVDTVSASHLKRIEEAVTSILQQGAMGIERKPMPRTMEGLAVGL